jgi:hypothetical protein
VKGRVETTCSQNGYVKVWRVVYEGRPARHEQAVVCLGVKREERCEVTLAYPNVGVQVGRSAEDGDGEGVAEEAYTIEGDRL